MSKDFLTLLSFKVDVRSELFKDFFLCLLTLGLVIAGGTWIRRAKGNRWGEGKYYYLQQTYIP